MEENDRGGRAEGDQDGARNLLGVLQAENHHRNGKNGNRGGRHGERVPRPGKRLHAVKEVAGNVIHLQAEEVADLRAGDENGDSVRETNDHRPRKIFHHRAHAGDAKKHQQHASHHRARQEPVDSMFGDNPCDDHHESAGGAADLRFRAA